MNIRKFRKDYCKTQQEISDDLGVSLKTYQNYERGLVTIPNKQLERLAEYFKVSIADLFADAASEKNTINLNNVEVDVIANYIVDNWDKLMVNKLFSANFRAQAGEWVLKIKKDIEGIK